MTRPWRILVALAGLVAALTALAIPVLAAAADREPRCEGGWVALCDYEEPGGG